MRSTTFLIAILALITPPQYTMAQKTFDWQGHRGCRGLLPENTIPAFLKALDLGVVTLEMDLAVSSDMQLIISHDPWFNHDISTKPNGALVTKEEEESLAIFKMTTSEVQKYDVGSRGNPRFPEQQKLAVHKPTLSEMVEAVKQYCADKKRDLPYFNIEIKSQPKWDGAYTPSVSEFAALVVSEIKQLGIKEKTCVQSFDPRALEAVKKLDASIVTAFLIENIKTFEENLKSLSFRPEIYSPYFKLISKKTVKKCHKLGIRIIPWTVNESSDLIKIKEMGVDGIITDYPNRIPKE